MDTTFDERYFEEMADLEARHPWTQAMRALTLALLERETRRSLKCVLDAGCGTGLFLNQWLESGQAAFGVGVDLYPEALGWAHKRARGTWVVASAADLPFRPGSFDAIHSADVLQHLSLSGASRALDLFALLLAPGGTLALRVRAPRIFRNEPDADYSQCFSRRRLKSELERRGFGIRFLSHVNALPSIWAEIPNLRGSAKSAGAVKGIQHRSAFNAASRLLSAYLAIESAWLLGVRLALPMGHTVICIARKRG